MKGKQSMRHCNTRIQNIQQNTEKAMTRQRKIRKNIKHYFTTFQIGNCVKIRKLVKNK